MDYTDAIRAVLGADDEAKRLDAGSRRLQREAPKELEEKIGKRKAQIQKQAGDRISKNEAAEAAYKKTQIKKLEKEFAADMAALEKVYAEQKEKYAETLFKAVIEA